jgi:hypothetical protein
MLYSSPTMLLSEDRKSPLPGGATLRLVRECC